MPDSLITKKYSGIDWNGLYTLVEESDIEYKDSILNIMNNIPEETWRKVNPTDRWMSLVDSRIKHLQDLKYGNPYRDMVKRFFPQLRRGSIVTIYFEVVATPIVEDIIEVIPIEQADTITSVETAPVAKQAQESVETTNNIVEDTIENAESEKKPLFVIKTNLLYDIALTPNLKIEVPIGNRWSVGVQAMCGWWSKSDNSFVWQIQAADLEARYWFGDRTDKRVLSGWFAGAFASGGFYDFQFKDTHGLQGEFYVLTGVSGGYSMPIGRSMNLEFSAGVGYIVNNYQRYVVYEEEYLVADGPTMRYQSLFPAKVEVSLGWLLFRGGGEKCNSSRSFKSNYEGRR